jgi:hypothetical protein
MMALLWPNFHAFFKTSGGICWKRLLTLVTPARRLAGLHTRPKTKKAEQTMTDPDLFNETEQTISATAAATRAIPLSPATKARTDNPFQWSCSLWEALGVGQCLHSRGLTTFASASP